jgi:peptidoglycan/xylan/chitin deacetylase (PgdA/CDA1 family)
LGVASSPDQNDERRRQMFRRRRAFAAAAALAAVALVWGLAAGAGHDDSGNRRAAQAPRPPKPKPPPPRRKPTPIDRALGYTNYITHGSPRRREVALTFDDGPSQYTRGLVRALRRKHAPATFFPVGYAINAYGRQLRLVHRRGYPIGDHTMNHPLLDQFPATRQAEEIDGQAQLLLRAGVPYPRLFRPPYGAFDAPTLTLLHQRRMLMVLWSVNPEDYYRPGTKVIVKRVVQAVRPGAIVLMHDGGGDRSQTVAAVPRIVHQLRARGYRLVTVQRLLGDDPPPRHQGPPPNLAGV